jgi:hypothetical protein
MINVTVTRNAKRPRTERFTNRDTGNWRDLTITRLPGGCVFVSHDDVRNCRMVQNRAEGIELIERELSK